MFAFYNKCVFKKVAIFVAIFAPFLLIFHSYYGLDKCQSSASPFQQIAALHLLLQMQISFNILANLASNSFIIILFSTVE